MARRARGGPLDRRLEERPHRVPARYRPVGPLLVPVTVSELGDLDRFTVPGCQRRPITPNELQRVDAARDQDDGSWSFELEPDLGPVPVAQERDVAAGDVGDPQRQVDGRRFWGISGPLELMRGGGDLLRPAEVIDLV